MLNTKIFISGVEVANQPKCIYSLPNDNFSCYFIPLSDELKVKLNAYICIVNFKVN